MRESGYYWCRRNNEWDIWCYKSQYDVWVSKYDQTRDSIYFDEIYENRIKEPYSE